MVGGAPELVEGFLSGGGPVPRRGGGALHDAGAGVCGGVPEAVEGGVGGEGAVRVRGIGKGEPWGD